MLKYNQNIFNRTYFICLLQDCCIKHQNIRETGLPDKFRYGFCRLPLSDRLKEGGSAGPDAR